MSDCKHESINIEAEYCLPTGCNYCGADICDILNDKDKRIAELEKIISALFGHITDNEIAIPDMLYDVSFKIFMEQGDNG